MIIQIIIIVSLLLYIPLEDYTIKVCKRFIDNALDNLLCKIGNMGYKISRHGYDDIKNSKIAFESITKNKVEMQLHKIAIFIPFINILTIKHIEDVENQLFIDKAIKSDIIVPMDKKEKEMYIKLNRQQKINYLISVACSNEDTMIIGFIGDKPIIMDYASIPIYYPKLTPLAYTLGEVKKLNKVLGDKYKLCRANGKNIAIIGVDDDLLNCNLKKLALYDEGKNSYPFEDISEIDAADKKFIVYPFYLEEDSQKKLDNCIEEIRCERHSSNGEKTHIKLLKL